MFSWSHIGLIVIMLKIVYLIQSMLFLKLREHETYHFDQNNDIFYM